MFDEILTNRLKLRVLLEADAESMFAYRSDPRVTQFQSWNPKSVHEVGTFISDMSTREFDKPGWYQIAIVLRSDDNLIGDCGIHFDSDPRLTEIGITISPLAHNSGYATEALSAILNLLFFELSKHRVQASVDPRNLASMALMKRVGFRQEAHFIQSIWSKDMWTDDVVFGLLSSEWETKSG